MRANAVTKYTEDRRVESGPLEGEWRHDHYPTLADLLAVAGSKTGAAVWATGGWGSCSVHESGMDGAGSLRDAVKVAREGCPKMLDKARESLRAVSVPRLSSQKRRPVRCDDGDEIDIAAVYSGNLDTAWRVSKRTRMEGLPRAVRVLVEVTIGGEQRDTFWRGAAAIAICDMLEDAGVPCEVWALSSASSCRGFKTKPDGTPKRKANGDLHVLHGFVTVCLHEPGEPLDMARIAVAAWKPFERLICWRALCAIEGAKGIGGACAWPFPLEEGDILIDQVFGKEDAEALLKKSAEGIYERVNKWLEIYGSASAALGTGDVLSDEQIAAGAANGGDEE